MIVIDERSDGVSEMPLTQRYDSRQTLDSDGPYESFGERVQVRTSGGQEQWLDTLPQFVLYFSIVTDGVAL
jgi:hypothetical protein